MLKMYVVIRKRGNMYGFRFLIFSLALSQQFFLCAAALAAEVFEQAVVELVNLERRTQGRAPLKRVGLLDASSGLHSDNMASRNFFDHCDLDQKTSPFQRMTAAGYNWNAAAENIAAGYSTPESVMAGWIGSAGHYANILSTSYREIGVGHSNQAGDTANVRRDTNNDCAADTANSGPYHHYWTQNFGRRSNVYPLIINDEAAETDTRDVGLYVYGSNWAQDMRFRNVGEPWSAWEPFSSEKLWQLSMGNGSKTVEVELRNANNNVIAASDSILLVLLCMAADDQLDLHTQVISFQMTFEACSLINAWNNFEVETPGNVTLKAPTIRLGPGFVVRQGARFKASSVVP